MATTLPDINTNDTASPVSLESTERLEEMARKHGWSLDDTMRRALDITAIVLDAKNEDPQSKVYVYRGGKRYALEVQD